ncbi:uncharacterized protein PMUG01_05040800 [Plasmodium malariae]|uniref:Cysteine-rich protective antigen 6 bladed domain-containing protein n=1 Tax=Plasmodium malariae TaxID=5858 RepID=A0A1D3JLR6_PLAMA|nr:uncharacterized protein PMUG01_05040800 [Plasmodium malariae]SBT87544.1 hypothetical protein PMUG01_05040800 [Plasmodium malariae]
MILLRIALFLLHIVVYLCSERKNKNIILINDETSSLNNTTQCSQDVHFAFKKELYKYCVEHDIKNTESHVYIQKKENNRWISQSELLGKFYKIKPVSIFNFVDDNQIILIICEYINNDKTNTKDCYRWSSQDGTTFTKENVVIDNDIFNNKNYSSYSSAPLKISNKTYLLICGTHSNQLKNNKNEDHLASCTASDDDGRNWRTQIKINYSGFQADSPFFALTPHIFNDELGFYFYTGVNISTKSTGGQYIACSVDNGTNISFNCNDVNLFKENKLLQNITKLSDHYLTNYIDKDYLDLCYLYYTKENAIMIGSPKHIYNDHKCYNSSIIKEDESTFFFTYYKGHGLQNMHSIHYTQYD